MKNNVKPFDKVLIKYQKISLLPLIVTLASFFSSLLFFLFNNPSTFLMLGLVYIAKDNSVLYFSLSILFILFGLFSSLFSAKGKIINFLIFFLFYLIDTICLFFAFSSYQLAYYIGSISIHLIVLLILSLGIIFYKKAKKELKKENK
ncbi:MAG TPA: hypothetical protein DD377_05305 [Firmicutes bacterium]|nr:hypothetical protein [Bacillota bacterium]